MEATFVAHFVYVSEDNGTLLVGVADQQFDTRDCILFSRDREPTDQDRALGLDQIHVEYRDQAHSGYGGIEQVVLSSHTLLVMLTEQGAAQFGAPRRIRAELAVAESDVRHLADGLRQIMPEFFVRDRQQK